MLTSGGSCGIISMYLREAVKSSTEKKFKKFQKRLDKLLKVWYNNKCQGGKVSKPYKLDELTHLGKPKGKVKK